MKIETIETFLNHFSKFPGEDLFFWIFDDFSKIWKKILKFVKNLKKYPHLETLRSDLEVPKEGLFQFSSKSEHIYSR